MMQQIKWDTVQRVFRIRPDDFSSSAIHEIEHERKEELASLQIGGDTTAPVDQKTVKRATPKVGRNDPCPCGSKKKFKHCCGR